MNYVRCNCGHIECEQIENLEAQVKLCEEVLEELVDILSDSDARKEIDSFTVQPAKQALEKLAAMRDGK